MNKENSKNYKYFLVVVLLILLFLAIYHFSHNREEEIILPNFLINTNAEVVVTDIPGESTVNNIAD